MLKSCPLSASRVLQVNLGRSFERERESRVPGQPAQGNLNLLKKLFPADKRFSVIARLWEAVSGRAEGEKGTRLLRRTAAKDVPLKFKVRRYNRNNDVVRVFCRGSLFRSRRGGERGWGEPCRRINHSHGKRSHRARVIERRLSLSLSLSLFLSSIEEPFRPGFQKLRFAT